MSRTFVVLAVLLAASMAFADPPRRRGRDWDHDADAAVLNRDRVNQKLSKLNQLLTDSIGKAHGQKEKDELRAIRSELDELRDYVSSAPDYVVVQQPPPPVVVNPPPVVQPQLPPPPPNQNQNQNPPPAYVPPAPIAPPSFTSLQQAINREGFSEGKIRVLQTAAQLHYFTVAQVKMLLNLYPFSRDKLTAVSILRPRIVDPQNNFQLYDAFPMSSDKQTLSRILQGGAPRNAPRR